MLKGKRSAELYWVAALLCDPRHMRTGSEPVICEQNQLSRLWRADMDSERTNADYIDCKVYLSESADVIEQLEVGDEDLKTELKKVSSFLRGQPETS